MLSAVALALVLTAGQEPVIIGNTARPSRPSDRESANLIHRPGPGTDRTRGVQVCRDEPVTGSRFPRRVCQTRYEADSERHEGRSVLRRMQGSRVPDEGG